ncbi:FETUB protein, partial [Baryphthengus martii]|nr:FETUB protein [Baryphthengus martii]
QEIGGSVFYLILDVIDTECHVLSKKSWKDCKARAHHSTVYGQCKTSIYMNQQRNIAYLIDYDCTMQPVPPKYIGTLCPDCPIDASPTGPMYLETAVQCLAKFNEESEQTHYFSILNVTRASMQWVIGPAYFVEFLIQETSCSKNRSKVSALQCEKNACIFLFQKIGFCKGSVVNSRREHQQFVTISCEIYNPQ